MPSHPDRVRRNYLPKEITTEPFCERYRQHMILNDICISCKKTVKELDEENRKSKKHARKTHV